jgi:hypothetical protein
VVFGDSEGQTTIIRTLTYPSSELYEAALDTATKDGMDMTSTVHAALLERVL